MKTINFTSSHEKNCKALEERNSALHLRLTHHSLSDGRCLFVNYITGNPGQKIPIAKPRGKPGGQSSLPKPRDFSQWQEVFVLFGNDCSHQEFLSIISKINALRKMINELIASIRISANNDTISDDVTREASVKLNELRKHSKKNIKTSPRRRVAIALKLKKGQTIILNNSIINNKN